MVQDRAIVTTADYEKVIHGLSNRTIFNDLELLQSQISRSGNSLTLNISEIAKDTTIVCYYGRRIRNSTEAFKWYQVPLTMTLSDL